MSRTLVEKLPWNRPVPLRASSFIPLARAGEVYNVETDLSQIGAFSCSSPRSAKDLLYADQQSGAVNNNSFRMGSGRSGYYRGKYLKGVGRTILAGNWNESDHYHNSGHLLPSGAIREFLITRYLEARGVGDTIVRCEGLLLRPLPKEMRAVAAVSFSNGKTSLEASPKIDAHLQAITYKEGNFARSSNLIWYLRSMGVYTGRNTIYSLGEFVTLFSKFLSSERSRAADRDLTPQLLIEKLADSQERLLDHFLKYLRAGVFWGSFCNNYSLDGRFLDLEMPLILGGPFLGAISTRFDKPSLSVGKTDLFTGGLEMVQIAHDSRIFNRVLLSQLEHFIAEKAFCSSVDLDYADQIASSLRAYMRGDGRWMESRAGVVRVLVEKIDRVLHLGRAGNGLLRNLIGREYDMLNSFGTAPMPEAVKRLRLYKIPFAHARPEPEYAFHPYSFFELSGEDFLEEARWINNEILEIEKMSALGQVIERIQKSEKTIHRHVSKMK